MTGGEGPYGRWSQTLHGPPSLVTWGRLLNLPGPQDSSVKWAGDAHLHAWSTPSAAPDGGHLANVGSIGLGLGGGEAYLGADAWGSSLTPELA